MKVTTLKIPEVKLIEPNVFEDERGFFYESFNQQKFNETIGQDVTFVQDNHSKSKKGDMRGLHYQEEPCAQGKLVRVISGEVIDVAVDVRKNSPTYGQWLSEVISSDNKKQLWIPEGFAHGFLTLSDYAEVLYKATRHYSKRHEKSISFNHADFDISWPEIDVQITLSQKDTLGL